MYVTYISYLNEGIISDEFIYHGTSKGAALRIQKSGIMSPSDTGEKELSISFTNDIVYAEYYAKAKGGIDKMVILRTKLSDKFHLSPRINNNKGDEYITFEPIPTSELEILTHSGEWVSINKWDIIFNEPI